LTEFVGACARSHHSCWGSLAAEGKRLAESCIRNRADTVLISARDRAYPGRGELAERSPRRHDPAGPEAGRVGIRWFSYYLPLDDFLPGRQIDTARVHVALYGVINLG